MEWLDLERVFQKEPDLKRHGFKNGKENFSYEDFKKCVEWISEKYTPSKLNSRKNIDSYVLKHILEEEKGGYVPNGAVIAAAICLNIPYKRLKNNPNAILYMKELEA